MILLENCYRVAREDGPDLSGVDILVKGNRIAKIGPNLEPDRGRSGELGGQPLLVIDASRHVVLPGLVNTHHHFYQTLTRNLP
ncbi:MAG TPA: 8-oxoguanine deaminase, partial [Rectinemataceae bacterium]